MGVLVRWSLGESVKLGSRIAPVYFSFECLNRKQLSQKTRDTFLCSLVPTVNLLTSNTKGT